MGLETAKFMKGKTVILSGRTVSKLDHAVKELESLGIRAIAQPCDTSDRASVKGLAEFAASQGEITTVINCAGMSPTMAGGEKLIRVNALGTVYVNQEFSKLMKKGVIVDISSNSAYSLPNMIIPKKAYELAETDEEAFVKKLLKRANIAKGDYNKAGFAYALSKNFVVWYAQKSAFELGKRYPGRLPESRPHRYRHGKKGSLSRRLPSENDGGGPHGKARRIGICHRLRCR